jgi:hypothetical protein
MKRKASEPTMGLPVGLSADVIVGCVEEFHRLGVQFVQLGEMSRWMARRGSTSACDTDIPS